MPRNALAYCEHCSKPFQSSVRERRFCGKDCRTFHHLAHWRQRDETASRADTARVGALAEGDTSPDDAPFAPMPVAESEIPQPLPIPVEVVARADPSAPIDSGERANGAIRRRKPPKESEAAPPADAPNADDTEWAERGDYWQAAAEPMSDESPLGRYAAERVASRRNRPSLVLAGHGVRLSIDRGALLVRDGFTHYPQQRQEWRYFPGDRKMPARIILLNTDGSISLDVLRWLSDQHVPLSLLDWQGNVVSAVGSDGNGADVRLRQAQIAASGNGVGMEIARRLIQHKIIASAATIRTLPATEERDRTLEALNADLDILYRYPPEDAGALRLLEGRAAASYWRCWRTVPLRWQSTGRTPVADDWRTIGLRESSVSGSNRRASHPVNAILNYVYAVLESQVRIACAVFGIDPTVGYLHTVQTGRLSLVFDLMEPLRPQLDRLVLNFLLSHVFTPRDVLRLGDGAIRLHPQLARSVAGIALPDDAVRAVAERFAGWLRDDANEPAMGAIRR